MNSKKILPILAVVFLGGLLRTLRLNDISFNNDELYNLVHVYNLDMGWDRFIEPFLSWEIHPPLSHMVLFVWSKAFGISEISLRLVGALLGTFTILTVFETAKLLTSPKASFMAALFFSINYASIALSRMATFHGMNIFFCSLSFYLGLRILLNPQVNKKHLVLYPVLLILMGYINYFAFAFALFQLLLFIISSNYVTKLRKKYFSSVFLIVVLFYATWVPIILKQYQNLKTHDYDRTPGDYAIYDLLNFLFNGQPFFLFFIFLLILAKLFRKPTYNLKITENFNFFIILATCCLPILTAVLYNQVGQPLWKNHYFGFMAPFFCVLSAQAIEYIPFRALKTSVAPLYVIGSLVGFYMGNYSKNYPIVIDLRALTNSVIEENHKSQQTCGYINYSWHQINFDYYLKSSEKKPTYLIENGELARLQTPEGIAELDNKIKKSGLSCFWFLNTYNETSAPLEDYLTSKFLKIKTLQHQKAYGILYAHSPGGRIEKEKRCLLVDNDGSFDDLRALTSLTCKQKVSYVVFTEGISRINYSYSNHLYLKEQFSNYNDISYFTGAKTNRKLSSFWKNVRARDEALNNHRKWKVLPTQPGQDLESLVETINQSCTSLNVLILGPYTSASEYLPRISATKAIYTFGNDNPIYFNCWFDLKSCQHVFSRFQQEIKSVNLPFEDANHERFSFSEETVAQLALRDSSQLLAQIFRADISGWKGKEISYWDDSVVAFFFQPQLFELKDHLYTPIVGARKLESAILNSLNNCFL